jgi:hypothetical protein
VRRTALYLMSHSAYNAFEQFEKRYLGRIVVPGKTRDWRSLDPVVEEEICRSWSNFVAKKSPEAKRLLQHSRFKLLRERPDDSNEDVTDWIVFLRSWLLCFHHLEHPSNLNDETSNDDCGIVVLKRGKRYLSDEHIEFMQIICDILKRSYRIEGD